MQIIDLIKNKTSKRKFDKKFLNEFADAIYSTIHGEYCLQLSEELVQIKNNKITLSALGMMYQEFTRKNIVRVGSRLYKEDRGEKNHIFWYEESNILVLNDENGIVTEILANVKSRNKTSLYNELVSLKSSVVGDNKKSQLNRAKELHFKIKEIARLYL